MTYSIKLLTMGAIYCFGHLSLSMHWSNFALYYPDVRRYHEGNFGERAKSELKGALPISYGEISNSDNNNHKSDIRT